MKEVKNKKKSGLTTILAVIVIGLFAYFNIDVFQDSDEDSTQVQNQSNDPVQNQGQSQEEVGATELIPVELVKTIDGDTIKVIYEGKEQNLRYLLVDTPETNHPQLGKQPFGQKAKERNTELMNSGKLEIEFDIGERVDKYGRLLAYVYIDGVSIQEKLIEEGLARVGYVYPPNTRHLDPFEKAQERAKKAGIGIWTLEDYVTERGFDGKNYKE